MYFTRIKLWLGLMMGIAGLGLAQAAQAGCACPVLPMAGTYGGDWPLALSYADGDDKNCPSILRIQAKRAGAPDADVELFCDATNQQWKGFEPSPFGEPFVYILSATIRPGMQHHAEYAEQLQASLRASDTIHLKLMIPAKLISMGKKGWEMDLALMGKGRPAPCMCAKVRDEIAYIKRTMAGYNDADLLAKARQEHIRGTSPLARYWMDDDRKLHRFSATLSEIDYEDMVDIHVDGEASTANAAKPQVRLGKEADNSLDAGTYAGTNAISCQITMPPAADVRASCDPAIVLQAAYAHENVHQELCRKMNASTIYYLPNGRKVDWVKDAKESVIMIGGRIYPRSSAYKMWSQAPGNVSRDEIAAYSAEIKILNQWLETNCT